MHDQIQTNQHADEAAYADAQKIDTRRVAGHGDQRHGQRRRKIEIGYDNSQPDRAQEDD